jgi:hypothetical protein
MLFIGYGYSFIAGLASFRVAWDMQFVPARLHESIHANGFRPTLDALGLM